MRVGTDCSEHERDENDAHNGFNIGFDDDEHPVLRTEVNSRVDSIQDDKVTVVATFSIRDNSGTFDDPYSGFIDVVVVVDRV